MIRYLPCKKNKVIPVRFIMVLVKCLHDIGQLE